MNQVKHNMDGLRVKSEPLFASSWMALFIVLRNSMTRGREHTDPVTSPKDRSTPASH